MPQSKASVGCEWGRAALALLFLGVLGCRLGGPPQSDLSAMVLVRGGAHWHRGQRIVVSDFLLGATEVTTSAYKECVDSGSCHWTAPSRERHLRKCNMLHLDVRGSHPMNCVTARQAQEFCQSIGGRLPTAVEWRWAAENRYRRTKWPWGARRPRRVERCIPEKGAYSADTCPVEASDRSLQGITGMGGNVGEWVFFVNGQRFMVMGRSTNDVYFSERGRDLSRSSFIDEYSEPEAGFRCADEL